MSKYFTKIDRLPSMHALVKLSSGECVVVQLLHTNRVATLEGYDISMTGVERTHVCATGSMALDAFLEAHGDEAKTLEKAKKNGPVHNHLWYGKKAIT